MENNPRPGPLLGARCLEGYVDIMGRCVLWSPPSAMILPGHVAPPMAEPPSRASLTYPVGPSAFIGRMVRRG